MYYLFPSALLLIPVLLTPFVVSQVNPRVEGPDNSPACSILSKKYPNLTLIPSSTAYTATVNNTWSQTSIAKPYCIFLPTTANDISDALSILRQTKTKFAVRSGGHMPNPGANSIVNGVLLSLTYLNTTSIIPDSSGGSPNAVIGAGLKWGAVYPILAAQGLTVAGGRWADVGVGGLLLGGGISHFGSQVGWAVNQIQGYQIVLADGRILNISSTDSADADLFWALKGGASNFGIVTSFTLKTFRAGAVYGGFLGYNSSGEFDGFVKAVAEFVTPGKGIDDKLAAIEPNMYFFPGLGQVVGITQIFYNSAVTTAPAALQPFTTINHTYSDASPRSSFAAFNAETGLAQFHDYSKRQLFWTVSVKATPEAVYLVNRTFAPLAMSSLRDVPGFSTSINHQPISRSWIEAAKAAGGDVLDLNTAEGPVLSIGITSYWDNEADDVAAIAFTKDAAEVLTATAKNAGLLHPFQYLNDASSAQRPFDSYGCGRSLPRLRRVAKKYDPEGVFQTLMPGGFKVFY